METIGGILVILELIAGIVLLGILSVLYSSLRRKMNRPKIGLDGLLVKMLKHDDYVCINGRVMQFSHWTTAGETINPIMPPLDSNQAPEGCLAFESNGVGYIIYSPAALSKCEFIYGKYGLKWALSKEWALRAKGKIRDAN